MRSSEQWSQWLGAGIAALALVVAALVLVPRWWSLATGPEVEIITVLKRTEREGLSLAIPGVAEPLTSREHHFARITVSVAPGGERAEAWATLDFTGALGGTEVSSLGVERVLFVRKGWEWVCEGEAAPRLVAVVAALEARRRALELGDEATLAGLRGPRGDRGGEEEAAAEELASVLAVGRRRYTVEGWYVRLERESAQATERWRLEGVLPDRPVDRRGERRLMLGLVKDRFLFSPWLM